MLGELVQIILATSYLSTTGTPGTWILETASRPASPLAVITYPRSRERWLADPAQYLIQVRDIYNAATETATLHAGHPFTHDPDAVFAQMTRRSTDPSPGTSSPETPRRASSRRDPGRPGNPGHPVIQRTPDSRTEGAAARPGAWAAELTRPARSPQHAF